LALIPSTYLKSIKKQIYSRFYNLLGEGIGINISSPNSSKFSLYELKSGPLYSWITDRDFDQVKLRNFGELYKRVVNELKLYSYPIQPKEELIRNLCPICYINLGSNESKCNLCGKVLQHESQIYENQEPITFLISNGQVQFIERNQNNPQDQSVINSPIFKINKLLRYHLKKLLTNDREIIEILTEKRVFMRYNSNFDDLGKASKRLFTDASDEDENLEVYDVSYIKGDGDNFGLIKSLMPNITMYRKISKIFEYIIENTLFKALSKILHFQLKNSKNSNRKTSIIIDIPFYVIYFSGDDFFLVLDAGFTHLFLKFFQEEIQSVLGACTNDYNQKEITDPLSVFKLGVSIGCLTCKNRTPIYLTLESVNLLETLAKQISKAKRQKYGGEVCIAMQKVESIPSKDLIDNRYNNDCEILITDFPKLSKDMDDFRNDLKELVRNKIDPNLLTNIITYDETRDDYNRIIRLKLEIKYRHARELIKQKQDTTQPIDNKYKIVLKKIFKTTNNGKHVLRHFDFIDSLKLINKEEKLIDA
ncbi:MAG: Cas10/Cmr2 second palm domain-containing protein, partial [Promethearchaeota archaeon]